MLKCLKYSNIPRHLLPFILSLLALGSGQAQAADTCRVTAASKNTAYETFKACVSTKNYTQVKKLCALVDQNDTACRQLAYEHALKLIDSKQQQLAAQWLFYAANHGHALAQHQLGLMFSVGTGVNISYAKAHTFFTMARENGVSPDPALAKMVADKLTPQIKQRAKLYQKVLKDRGEPAMEEVGEFTDVMAFTKEQRQTLKQQLAMCNVLSLGVKKISQLRDQGRLSAQSVAAGHQLVMSKLKNPPQRVADHVEVMLKKVSVLVYLGKNIKPEPFRLYYFNQCMTSAVKDERPVIELSSVHDVLQGLEQCQSNPGVANPTDFGVCLKKHVLPHVARKI